MIETIEKQSLRVLFWMSFAAFATTPLRVVTAAVTGDEIIDLARFGMWPERLVFLGDNTTLLLVSNRDQKLAVFNVESRTVTPLALATAPEPVEISDVTLDGASSYAYLAGSTMSGYGIVVRVDLSDATEPKRLVFSEEFFEPSVAVTDRHILVADLNASTVTAIERSAIEEIASAGKRLDRRSDLGKSIYLKDGPAADLGTSQDGRFIVVSHAGTTAVSLINLEYGEVVDSFDPLARGRHALPLVVRSIMDRGSKSPRPVLGFAIADFEKDVLVTAYVDEEFQSIRETENASLNLKSPPPAESEWRSPLILSASENMDTIVVASRTQTKALFRAPLVARIVELRVPPSDVAVSPDGTRAAILGSAAPLLQIIGNPLEWASSTGSAPGSDRIREAQALLSSLRFPVGSVDGMDGPSTQRAVRIFQESAGLPPSGALDPTTVAKIREVAAEAVPVTGVEDVDPVALGQCAVVDTAMQCSNRFRAAETSSLFDGANTVEVICAAPAGSPMPVQIDTHTSALLDSEYQCTSFHSCAFVRYRDLPAYRRICGGEEAQQLDQSIRPLSPILRSRSR